MFICCSLVAAKSQRPLCDFKLNKCTLQCWFHNCSFLLLPAITNLTTPILALIRWALGFICILLFHSFALWPFWFFLLPLSLMQLIACWFSDRLWWCTFFGSSSVSCSATDWLLPSFCSSSLSFPGPLHVGKKLCFLGKGKCHTALCQVHAFSRSIAAAAAAGSSPKTPHFLLATLALSALCQLSALHFYGCTLVCVCDKADLGFCLLTFCSWLLLTCCNLSALPLLTDWHWWSSPLSSSSSFGLLSLNSFWCIFKAVLF